ncbi:CU044_5270 family protein [Cryptosporangium minutisporangium]|uniref:CU044_5270 family protein n=1 Tax=Cryptosporangium minutisporangium TaxID=113569 RepID=A0ABP6T9H0_9ACTN
MNAGLEDDLRRLFGPLDPAPAEARSAGRIDEADRDADLRTILGSGAPGAQRAVPPRGARPTRRRAFLVGAAAAAVLAGTTPIAVKLLGSDEAAYAATPPPLTFRQTPVAPAAPALERIAARTTSLPDDTGEGRYRHITVVGWYLDSATRGGTTTSAVVPRKTEKWLAEDGSGRSVTTTQPATFESEDDRHWWSRLGEDDDRTVQTWSVGEYYGTWKQPAPTDPRQMTQFLRINHPVANGPAGVFTAVTDLCREQVLTPPQRAALLRSLATVPGLRAAGSVTDRSGRHGEAFLLDSAYSGLPTQYTVIVDPANGRLLGWEQMLTKDAGRLNVRIPAVLTYETLTRSEYTSTDGE